MGVFVTSTVSILLAISQWVFLLVLWSLRVFGVMALSAERNPWLHGAVLAVMVSLFVLCVAGNLVLMKRDPRIKTVFMISIGVGLFGLICALISIPAIIQGM